MSVKIKTKELLKIMIKMRINTQNMSIRHLVELRKIEYKRLKPIKCPLLDNEEVHFNKEGFRHLTHDGRGKMRGQADQRMRLNLLPSVIQTIKSPDFIGSPNRIIEADSNKLGKPIAYYEITREFNPKKTVSVILRRKGNGLLQYYSVRYYKKSKTKKDD